MAYVIGPTCIDEKDLTCVGECPVDCIYGEVGDRMLFIDPKQCIDCDACVHVCPVDAIAHEDAVPTEWSEFTTLNAQYFVDRPAVRSRIDVIADQLDAEPDGV